MPIIVGILVVALTFYMLQSFPRASPALLARLLKGWAGFMALALGGLLLLRGTGFVSACARADFWEERIRIMAWWADPCDEMRRGGVDRPPATQGNRI